jgi:hypothetical protein
MVPWYASGGVGTLLYIHYRECPCLSDRDPKSQSGKPSNGDGPECLINAVTVQVDFQVTGNATTPPSDRPYPEPLFIAAPIEEHLVL